MRSYYIVLFYFIFQLICSALGSIGSKSPDLCQHTEEVLLELGYTWDDIASLKEDGVML